MSRTTTMTVRLGGALSDFVSANVGDDGSYENVSEYIRDLIRRDKERAEQEAFNRLKAELAHAFAAPEETYQPLTAAEVIGLVPDETEREGLMDAFVEELEDACDDDPGRLLAGAVDDAIKNTLAPYD